MKNLKTRVAAGAAILGLGGLTGLALSAGNQKAASLATKPLVKTKVIHRTVRITKHVKPKNPIAAGGAPSTRVAETHGSSSGGVTTGSSSSGASGYSPSEPVTTSTSGSSSAPSESESAPVVTHTSGSSAGPTSGTATPVVTGASGGASANGGERGDHESEGGGDD